MELLTKTKHTALLYVKNISLQGGVTERSESEFDFWC